VILEQASYLDQQVTNELAAAVAVGEAGDVVFDALTLWVNPDGYVLPLGMTGSADTLGGGVLAITVDGWVVGGRRGKGLSIAAGRADVTASGSFKVPGPEVTSFRSWVGAELRRELREEAGAALGEVAALELVAVYRDLYRGGKPEVLAVARLDTRLSDLTAGDDMAELEPLGQVRRMADLERLVRETCELDDVPVSFRVLGEILSEEIEAPFGRSQLEKLF